MLLKTKRKIIYALLSVLLFSVSLFCVTNVNNLNIAKADETVVIEILSDEYENEEFDAVTVVASTETEPFFCGRYLYFTFNGSAMEISFFGDGLDDFKLSIDESGLFKYFCIIPGVDEPMVFGTATLTSGNHCKVDLSVSSLWDSCIGLRVDEVIGSFTTVLLPSLIKSVSEIPLDVTEVVADFYNSGTEFQLLKYIYFQHDGTVKRFEHAGGCQHFYVYANGNLALNGLKQNIVLEDGKCYCLNVESLYSSCFCVGAVHTVEGVFYTSNVEPTTSFTVSLDMNGHGTQYSDITIESGEKIPEDSYLRSNIPESDDGYWFTGWYDEDDKVFDFNTPITKNTILHAVWIEQPFTANYVSELPAKARKVKVGDVITNQKIYLVATGVNPTDICFNSEYTKTVGHAQNVRLHSFFTDRYTDLICWSFPCFRNEQYSLDILNDYGFGCYENVSDKKIVEVQYNNYYLGEITEIKHEDKLNLYILDPDNSDINTPTNESDTIDNLLTVLKMGVTFATAAAAIFVVLRFIDKKKEK